MTLNDMISLWKADARAAQRRRAELERLGGFKKAARPHSEGKPVCSNCGGPVSKTPSGHYRMTCSPECESARRKAKKQRVMR